LSEGIRKCKEVVSLSAVILQPFQTTGISLLRLDLPDPLSGGNKLYKLKYNLEEMRRFGKNTLLTFGGAYSNHIAAVAKAGKDRGFQTIGIIRGEELNPGSNPVLQFAAECGMRLVFISREDYRKKNEPGFIEQLRSQYGDFYFLPEGGSNSFAVNGCREILPPEAASFDVIICPAGTGATLAGIIASALPHQLVTGIAVLSGKNYLENEIQKLLTGYDVKCKWQVRHDFTFGGYGKSSAELEAFIAFRKKENLPLDPVYSGKSFFAALQIAGEDPFRGKRILFVHTGGYAFFDSGPRSM
jgi:1-aminocyclopropane-1-carboxylate deaminase